MWFKRESLRFWARIIVEEGGNPHPKGRLLIAIGEDKPPSETTKTGNHQPALLRSNPRLCTKKE